MSDRDYQASPGTCPALFFDGFCDNPDWREPYFDFYTVYISTISCSASCIGSGLIVLVYLLWKDVRTSLRTIVTYLAIADFFTAAGYLLGNVNYVHYKNGVVEDEVEACYLFDTVCQIQAFVTSWSSMSSFIWTAILAVYLYCALVKGDPTTPDRYFPVYHVLSWGSPLLVMLPLLCTGSLGFSPFAAGGWCYIAADYTAVNSGTYAVLNAETVALILVGGKAVEISTYVLVIVMYSKIQWSIRKKVQPVISGVARKAEHTLAIIPILFILLRMWGTLQFFFSIFVYATKMVDSGGCVPRAVYYIYLIITCAQALGDSGQGWGNSIIYIFLSKTIRQRLIVLPMQSFCIRVLDRIIVTSNKAETSHYHATKRAQRLAARVECYNNAPCLPSHMQGLEVSLCPSVDLITTVPTLDEEDSTNNSI